MSDCESKANNRQKKQAFLADYPLNEARVYAELYAHFCRWLECGDYDELDRIVIFCRHYRLPIVGVLLDEVANVAVSRLNREKEITRQYRQAQADIKIVKEHIYTQSITKVLLLIGQYELNAEDACFFVANWLRFKKYLPNRKATTVHQDCKEWLKKNKRANTLTLRDKDFAEQVGTFSRDPRAFKVPSEEFMCFIQSKLNSVERVIALSDYKLMSKADKELGKNNILDGMLEAVNTGDFCLSSEHRGQWDEVDRRILYNGTKFVQK